MVLPSSFESRNWNDEVRSITFSHGNCDSAVHSAVPNPLKIAHKVPVSLLP
jgi:hypothetical protein